MKPRHQVSKDAIELIKRFEGYRRAAAQLPDGGYTIGYGHTLTARAGVEIDERDAEALLRYDLITVSGAVNDLTFTPLTQNQFDALVCFAFNIGVENFRRSSVVRRVNEGNLLQAAAAFEIWRKSEFEGEKIVIDALIRRRSAEKALFLLPAAGYVPAPSPVLPPRVDYDVVGAGSRDAAVRMVVALSGANAVAVPEPSQGGLQDFVAVQPDRSPITIAAEVVAAKLQSIAPDEIHGEADEAPDALDETETETETAENAAEVETPVLIDPVAEPVPVAELVQEPVAEADAVEETTPDLTPVLNEPVLEPEPEAEPAPEPEVKPEAAPALTVDPMMNFKLTPPPVDLHIAEPEVVVDTAVEPQSENLPFDAPEPRAFAPMLDPIAPPPPPVNLASQAVTPRPLYRTDSTSGDSFLSFDNDTVKPMNFNLAPLLMLGVFGLAAFAFAIIWGLSTNNSGGGFIGPQLVSWVAGLVGIGCVVAAFYLLVSQLGGSEE